MPLTALALVGLQTRAALRIRESQSVCPVTHEDRVVAWLYILEDKAETAYWNAANRGGANAAECAAAEELKEAAHSAGWGVEDDLIPVRAALKKCLEVGVFAPGDLPKEPV